MAEAVVSVKSRLEGQIVKLTLTSAALDDLLEDRRLRLDEDDLQQGENSTIPIVRVEIDLVADLADDSDDRD